MTFLRAGTHLINMNRVTHIGPGTGGNNSTFHYDNGGITPSHMTLNEITHCLKRVDHPVADHHYRPPQDDATPTAPEGEEVHDGIDDPDLEDLEEAPEENPEDPEAPEDDPEDDPDDPEDPEGDPEDESDPTEDETPIDPTEPE